MKITFQTVKGDYEYGELILKSGECFKCPMCKSTRFQVWFTRVHVQSMTCLDCGDHIHIKSISKE